MHAVFWDRQTTETAQLLEQIVQDFNRGSAGLPLQVEKTGGYGDIYRKVLAGIQARTLPAMAVSYESMTTQYIAAGAAVPLDRLVRDPGRGFSEAELDDFFPVTLETNRYPQHGGKLYSFPFAKSVLMLYFNREILRKAGISEPPATWEEFLEQCRRVKTATGDYAHAIHVDCSTVSGMIFSMGGEILRGSETLYDQPAAIRVFELYEQLVREKLAYQITPGTFDDEVALANGQVAFTLRTSGGRLNMAMAMGDVERWGMAPIPQADPNAPGTVLFGPNVTLFDVGAEQVACAWDFVRHFTSVEQQVQWALKTGYLPIRRSAEQHPALQAHWKEWKYNRAAFDCLAFARTEPNVQGWQEIRGLVERELAAVLSGLKSGRTAALDLKEAADAVLLAQAQ
jgi:ABC-type glycerol-3-phosphate transport system substrate-binding protein